MLKAFLSGELADLIGGECDEKSILVKNFSHLVNADKNSKYSFTILYISFSVVLKSSLSLFLITFKSLGK